MIINELNREFHRPDNFREQTAVLYYVGQLYKDDVAIFMRSYIAVGLPGMTGFDNDKPGSNTLKAWQTVDSLVENQGVRGFFHTHPAGFDGFSSQDLTSMRGFAKTYGSRPLWYGVQSLGSKTAHFISMYMVGGKIQCFDFGKRESDPEEALIFLPIPPRIISDGYMFITNYA